jgi:hypothetical protein
VKDESEQVLWEVKGKRAYGLSEVKGDSAIGPLGSEGSSRGSFTFMGCFNASNSNESLSEVKAILKKPEKQVQKPNKKLDKA